MVLRIQKKIKTVKKNIKTTKEKPVCKVWAVSNFWENIIFEAMDIVNTLRLNTPLVQFSSWKRNPK